MTSIHIIPFPFLTIWKKLALAFICSYWHRVNEQGCNIIFHHFPNMSVFIVFLINDVYHSCKIENFDKDWDRHGSRYEENLVNFLPCIHNLLVKLVISLLLKTLYCLIQHSMAKATCPLSCSNCTHIYSNAKDEEKPTIKSSRMNLYAIYSTHIPYVSSYRSWAWQLNMKLL